MMKGRVDRNVELPARRYGRRNSADITRLYCNRELAAVSAQICYIFPSDGNG